MKLAVFSERFWPERGGGELATYLILKLLASTGDFEIDVYTGTQRPVQVPGASIKTIEFLRVSNKIHLYLNMLGNKRCIEKAIKKADIVYIPRFSYPAISIAKKLGKRVIIHLHDYQPISYTAVILSTEVHKPMSDFKRTLILESRSDNMPRALASTLATPLTKLIRRWVGMADKIICVSKHHEEVVLKFALEYRGKTTVIYNPAPPIPKIIKNLDNTPTFLYLGGSSHIKGFHIFLRASMELLKRGVKAKFILTNNYTPRHQASIKRLNNIYGNVYILLGRISHANLLKLHKKAWGLIFPSIWEEPLPYAVLEATLLETVPVVSKVGGVPEIVSQKAQQFLVTPGDASELADKIENLATMDMKDVCEIGSVVKDYGREMFDAERIARQLAHIFEL
ncbi:MAG: glycosyltransferase family 4 protein [Nitrososphaeria archaeon]